jgi:hypothetical protein
MLQTALLVFRMPLVADACSVKAWGRAILVALPWPVAASIARQRILRRLPAVLIERRIAFNPEEQNQHKHQRREPMPGQGAMSRAGITIRKTARPGLELLGMHRLLSQAGCLKSMEWSLWGVGLFS